MNIIKVKICVADTANGGYEDNGALIGPTKHIYNWKIEGYETRYKTRHAAEIAALQMLFMASLSEVLGIQPQFSMKPSDYMGKLYAHRHDIRNILNSKIYTRLFAKSKPQVKQEKESIKDFAKLKQVLVGKS